jgi:hypothetical protein
MRRSLFLYGFNVDGDFGNDAMIEDCRTLNFAAVVSKYVLEAASIPYAFCHKKI